MIEFLGLIVRQFGELRAIEQVAFVVGLLSLLGLPVLSWLTTLFRLRDSRKHIAGLEAVNASLTIERDRARREAAAERARAGLWMPEGWIGEANSERDQGNEEKAIGVLDAGFERLRQGFAQVCLELAGHHLSLTVGPDPQDHLAEGTRLTNAAKLLDPENADAALLWEEIALDRAEELDAVPLAFLPSSQDEGLSAIQALNAAGLHHLRRGRYGTAQKIYRRARLISERANLVRSVPGMNASLGEISALDDRGAHREASTLLDRFLERHHGSSHSFLLIARQSEASIRFRLGDFPAALETAREAAANIRNAPGWSPDAWLPLKTLEMDILAATGDPQNAYEGIVRVREAAGQIYLKADESTYHSNYYVIRSVEARILLALGKYPEAKAILNQVVSKQIEQHGEEENHVLESQIALANIDIVEGRWEAGKEELLRISNLLKRKHFQTHYLIRKIDNILASAPIEQSATDQS